MKSYLSMKSTKSGVALLLTIGVLTILSITAITFTIIMKLAEKKAILFAAEIQARYLAEAGIISGITQLRYWHDPWYGTPWWLKDQGMLSRYYDYKREAWYYFKKRIVQKPPHWKIVMETYVSPGDEPEEADHPSFEIAEAGGSGPRGYSGREFLGTGDLRTVPLLGHFSLKVLDCTGQINVNDNHWYVSEILKVLADELDISPDGKNRLKNIEIAPDSPYKTEEELRTGFSDDDFKVVRDYLTVTGYEEEGIFPLNINTVPHELLTALFSIWMDDDGVAPSSETVNKARALADWFEWYIFFSVHGSRNDYTHCRIESMIRLREYLEWAKNGYSEYSVKSCLEFAGEEITDTDIIRICTRADISRTDLDFPKICFSAGGIYEIVSYAAVGVDRIREKDGSNKGYKDKINKEDILLASKKIRILVKVNEMVGIHTKEGFEGLMITEPSSLFRTRWVTIDDNCPVRSDDNWYGSTPHLLEEYSENHTAEYLVVPNSIKLGYWDEFDNNNDNRWSGNAVTMDGMCKMNNGDEITLYSDSDDYILGSGTIWIYAEEKGNVPSVDSEMEVKTITGWIGFAENGECSQVKYVKHTDSGDVEGGPLCIEIGTVKELEPDPSNNNWNPPEFFSAKTYKIVKQNLSDSGSESYSLDIYLNRVANTLGPYEIEFNKSSVSLENGHVRLICYNTNGTWWDKLRIIPKLEYPFDGGFDDFEEIEDFLMYLRDNAVVGQIGLDLTKLLDPTDIKGMGCMFVNTYIPQTAYDSNGNCKVYIRSVYKGINEVRYIIPRELNKGGEIIRASFKDKGRVKEIKFVLITDENGEETPVINRFTISYLSETNPTKFINYYEE